MEHESSVVEWRRGTVDRAVEHFALGYREGTETSDHHERIALVGPPFHGCVSVQFLVSEDDPRNRAAIDAVVHEIEFYLIELGHGNAWRYCAYHCGTMANVYSQVQWEGFMSELERDVMEFESELGRFNGFDRLCFTVGELRDDSNWPWGLDHGVYCFLVGEQVVYVGRALGSTLGQRIADQLRHRSDPKWASVVDSRETRVEVFAVPQEKAYLGAALEAYLIGKLGLENLVNSRIS